MNTDFLGLILTTKEEKEMTFLEWRLLMNGCDDSNMQIIDNAIKNMDTNIKKKIDGFIYNTNTGEFQLTSNGEKVGDIITISHYDIATLDEVKEYLGTT